MKKILLYLVLFIGFVGIAQDQNKFKELLSDSKDYYETKNYELDVQYKVFFDASETHVVESYKGFIAKRGKDMYMKMHETETVLVNGQFIKVNHQEKAMIVSKQQTDFGMTAMKDMEKQLPNFETCKVIQKSDRIVCELKAFDVTQLPYSKVIMEFDKETKSLLKQELVLSTSMPLENEKGESVWTAPKATFTFSKPRNYKEKGLLSLSKYASFKNGIAVPAKELTDYQIEKI